MDKKILVVDDDPMIRQLVKAILEQEGYQIDMAADGKEAVQVIEAAAQNTYCMVVLDVMMPGMNGLDVLTRLRLHTHTQSLPVLMLTGEDKAEDVMAGYSVGADYYLTKPFTRQQLLFGANLVLKH